MVLNYRQWGLAAVLLLPLGLAACGGGGRDFSGPIKAFADTTAKATQAFNTGEKTFDAERTKERTALALANPGNVAPLDGECLGGAPGCRLGILENNVRKPILVSGSLKNAGLAIAAMADYAAALAEVAAVNGEKFAAATAETESALIKLATEGDKLLAKSSKPDRTSFASLIGDYGAPVRAGVNLLFDWYLEQQKLDALRTATTRVDKSMDLMAGLLTEVADGINAAVESDPGKKYRDAQRAYNDKIVKGQKPSEADLKAYLEASAKYDSALKLSLKPVAASMRDAHGKLTLALNDKLSPGELFKALVTFGERVAAVYDVYKKIEAAGDNPATAKDKPAAAK